MSAGNHQSDAGKHLVGVFEHHRLQVAVNVVDTDERLAPGPGERFGGSYGNQQSRRQAGTIGYRHGVNIFSCQAGLRQGLAEDRRNVFDVGTGGDFRHDAAERLMQMNLRRHHGGQNIAAVGDNRRGGFIAGTFQAQNSNFFFGHELCRRIQ